MSGEKPYTKLATLNKDSRSEPCNIQNEFMSNKKVGLQLASTWKPLPRQQSAVSLTFDLQNLIRWSVKGKGFPYSLPSIKPGADPSVEAVSPQVT